MLLQDRQQVQMQVYISVAHAVKSTLVTARNASIQRYAASTTVTHVRLDTNDIRL